MMNIIKAIEEFFGEFQDTALQTVCIAIIAVCAACIICVAFICSFKSFRRKRAPFYVILSTIAACLFMVPASVSFYKFIEVTIAKNVKSTTKAELEVLQLQIKNEEQKKQLLEKSNHIAEQNIEIEALNEELVLLKNSQINAMQFQKIAELALLKTNIQQTKVHKEKISETSSGLGIIASHYDDNLLLVSTHDIEAKFGVDIKQIRIKKVSGDTIQVSGIKPIFVGSTKNKTSMPVKEIRRENYDSDGHLKSIDVKQDSVSLHLADQYADKYNEKYQESLNNMENFEFLNDAIISLAQNFIQIIFASLYKNIEFVPAMQMDALPLQEFIASQIDITEQQKKSLEELVVNSMIETDLGLE